MDVNSYAARNAERHIRRFTVLTEYEKTFRPRYKISQEVKTGAFRIYRETPHAVGDDEVKIELSWQLMREPSRTRYAFDKEAGVPLEFAKIEEAEDYVFRLANPVVKIYSQTGLLERIEDVEKET